MQNLFEEYGGTVVVAILFSGIISVLYKLFEIVSV